MQRGRRGARTEPYLFQRQGRLGARAVPGGRRDDERRPQKVANADGKNLKTEKKEVAEDDEDDGDAADEEDGADEIGQPATAQIIISPPDAARGPPATTTA